jgi:hypothetical protein
VTTRKAAISPPWDDAPGHGRGGVARRVRLCRAAVGLIGVWAAYQMGLGAYFAAFRPPLLPEDLRFLGANAPGLLVEPPRFERWLDLVFLVLGGQMAALGMLLAVVALRLSRQEAVDRREVVLLGLAGGLSVAVMCAVNFALGSDFRWVLVFPVLVWLGGLASVALACSSRRASPAEGTHDR